MVKVIKLGRRLEVAMVTDYLDTILTNRRELMDGGDYLCSFNGTSSLKTCLCITESY